MKPLVSVIVVAFGNMDCLKICLESIEADPRIEVIVVNNSHQNRGFGAGCNLGVLLAAADVLLFLNPDTVASAESILSLAEVVSRDAAIGIAGPALANRDGQIVLSVSRQPTLMNFWWVYSFLNQRFYKTQLVRKHWYDHQPPLKFQDVGIISGAAMALRRQVFEQLKGFDEKFFLYWEEVDLARRCLSSGFRVVFEPAISVVHHGALSTPQNRGETMVWFRESRYYFMKKHFGGVYALAVEAWLALTEHWPLSLVLLALMWWQNPGPLVVATMVYNELVLRRNKTVAAAVGFLLAILAVNSPVWFWLGAGLVWIVVDLWQPVKRMRKYYVAAAVVGGLCLV